MTNEEAIRILQDELKHTEFHLKDKNKAEEFYEEMKLYCKALRLAIKALKEIEGLKEENHRNFVNSQHIISSLVEEIKKLRGAEND